ncbi:MAG: DUF5615 family PIN-like protein [Flavobacteriaceae bacterium]|nr:DUF5615 family PIN-like protein [Flavobacteriaceae bacterium]
MEFLCDVHISIKIAKSIEDLGYKCEHVNRILKKWNTTDEEIINYVGKNNLILITKDQDFRNSFLLNSTPNKLIKIDLGNISNEDFLKIITNLLPMIYNVNRENKKFMIEVSKSTSSVIIKE